MTPHEALPVAVRATKARGGVIFVTQLIDASDPVLGFAVSLLPALAARCDRLLVIANELRTIPPGIDAEFETLGKEAGRSRGARSLRYERLLLRHSRSRSFSGLLAHMCPAYASLAAPILRPLGMHIVLWFAHPRDSFQLALAERVSNRVVTSLPGAYPRPAAKVRAIGQAIDTRRWRFIPPARPASTLRLAAVGRTSTVKGYSVLIKAVEEAQRRGLYTHLRLVGPATTPAEVRHHADLSRLIGALGLETVVEILDGVPPQAVPAILAEADVVLNATRAGSGDKAVFEAMASGRPVLVSNPAFADLLSNLPVRLDYRDRDVNMLVDRLEVIAELTQTEREMLGRQLRARIVAGHSLSSWAEAVVEAVNEG